MQCKIHWKLDVQNGFMKIKSEVKKNNDYNMKKKMAIPISGVLKRLVIKSFWKRITIYISIHSNFITIHNRNTI